jgi:hypothetical protein
MKENTSRRNEFSHIVSDNRQKLEEIMKLTKSKKSKDIILQAA